MILTVTPNVARALKALGHDAVALSAAAVLQPTAGRVDLRDYHDLVDRIRVEEQHAPGPDH
jgi:2-methylisocitrate lyase-like PEP mutase family enzyme